MNSLPPYLRRIPGRVYLLVAVSIFGAANAVTRQLNELGIQHSINGHNPISFCNVLFVGNLVALAALLVFYRNDLSPAVVQQVTRRDWGLISLIALLSGALAPALFFMALEQTSVNNVVLISRIEPPLGLALSIFFLKARVDRGVIWGAAVSFIGVVLTVVLQPAMPDAIRMIGITLGRGELMAIAGAIAAAIATVISKASLAQFPLGLFNLVRTGLGTLIFFVATIVLVDISHFAAVFSPFLWGWMLLYSLVIVVGGQLAWFQGLKHSHAAEVSLANAFHPIAGILAAYLILAEAPTPAQYLGGSVILLGIILTQWGILRQKAPEPAPVATAMDNEIGFRGI